MKELKRRLLNFLLRHLYNSITEDDVLQTVNGKLLLEGRVLQSAERYRIAMGASTMKQLDFYELILKEMKMAANRKLYFTAATNEDMVFPRAVLWTIDVLEKKIDTLSKLQ